MQPGRYASLRAAESCFAGGASGCPLRFRVVSGAGARACHGRSGLSVQYGTKKDHQVHSTYESSSHIATWEAPPLAAVARASVRCCS